MPAHGLERRVRNWLGSPLALRSRRRRDATSTPLSRCSPGSCPPCLTPSPEPIGLPALPDRPEPSVPEVRTEGFDGVRDIEALGRVASVIGHELTNVLQVLSNSIDRLADPAASGSAIVRMARSSLERGRPARPTAAGLRPRQPAARAASRYASGAGHVAAALRGRAGPGTDPRAAAPCRRRHPRRSGPAAGRHRPPSHQRPRRHAARLDRRRRAVPRGARRRAGVPDRRHRPR